MTKSQLKTMLNVIGGQFVFATNRHEGMIGVSPAGVVIWVDDAGFGTPKNSRDDDSEPRNAGEYRSIDEMLSNFKVDGKLFVEAVLPEIEELNRIYV